MSPRVMVGGDFGAGSTKVTSVRCCAIEGDNSQPAQAADWVPQPPTDLSRSD